MSKNKITVLVTGGAGYIGSHCLVEFLNAGCEVIVIDNFTNSVNSNGKAPSLERVEQITGKKIQFHNCSLLDSVNLNQIFNQNTVDCVVHLAALKAVGESMQLPLLYYKNNVEGTINLLQAMESGNCTKMIFSSSFCVYGIPKFLPISENHPTGRVSNVYGRTKYFVEEILKDLAKSNLKWNIISLRYFNPAGAHSSGLIGEAPTKNIFNLLPFISQVAVGNQECVTIFGNDFSTADGTGVRDYVHIMDLAQGHVAALQKLFAESVNFQAYNLGSGHGVSTLDLIKAFQKVSGKSIPYKFEARRPGDIDAIFADTTLALNELKWKASQGIDQICEDFWRWQSLNPTGYYANENGNTVNE